MIRDGGRVDPDALAPGAPDPAQPLVAFAQTAAWVMQTLAHHTERSEDWVALMSKVDGLVSLAARRRRRHDSSAVAHARALLRTLVEVFETMRQCESDGFVASTLGSKELEKKDKAGTVREVLGKQYEQRVAALHERVATRVMAMLLAEPSHAQASK